MKTQSRPIVRYIATSFVIGALQLCSSSVFAGSPISSPNINGVVYVDGVTYTTIPAALAALGTNGGVVMVPPGTYNVSSTIYSTGSNPPTPGTGGTPPPNTGNNVFLICEGGGGGSVGSNSSPGLNSGTCVLQWNGTAGGTMVSWSQGTGGSNPISGGGVIGFDFEGGGVAAVGLHVSNEWNGQFKNNSFANFTQAALLLDCKPDTGTYNSVGNKSTQFNVFENLNFRQDTAAGNAIYDGDLSNLTSDPAFNTFMDIRITAYNSADAIMVSNADDERFYNVAASRLTSGTGAGVRLTGPGTATAANPGSSARNISFYGLDPGQGGLVQNNGAAGNVVHDYITENGAPQPLVGSTVSSGSLQWNEVGLGPTSNQMVMYQGAYPTTTGPALLSFDIPTGTASPATGSYALNSYISWNVNSGLKWTLGRANPTNDFALFDAFNGINRLYAAGGTSGATVIAAPTGAYVGIANDLQVQGYTQLATTSGSPPVSDCNSSVYGRMKVDPSTGLLWVCVGTGWISK